MTCVSIVTYAILVNGQPGPKITPTGDLRQGDPISSYLYLICAEGFSTILHDTEISSKIKGVNLARSSLTLSHSFFADDSIIFYRATIGD